MKSKNLLFITWDGPQTSYMEGLFMPIFQEIQKQNPEIHFHVLQFTWADEKKISQTRSAAEKMGITYSAMPVIRKPTLSIGSLITVFTSVGKIKKYITDHNIDIVMPRSTFPAMMINQIKKRDFRLIFDADGLPIEERIDFAGLKKDSIQYRLMKSAETKMLKSADAVITRSQKAIDIHIRNIGERYRGKFSVVYNGRDQNLFRYDEIRRRTAREKLGLKDEFLFVYAGSLGPQYCLPDMMEIFNTQNHGAKFLILTGNTEFAQQNIPEELQTGIILKSVKSHEVPFYLNAADMAFALRQPSFSMQGVAPIKLGEYLLCGLPVIASKGIGDSEDILNHFEECFLYDHAESADQRGTDIQVFIGRAANSDRSLIREKAVRYFSLEAAAESYRRALTYLSV